LGNHGGVKDCAGMMSGYSRLTKVFPAVLPAPTFLKRL